MAGAPLPRGHEGTLNMLALPIKRVVAFFVRAHASLEGDGREDLALLPQEGRHSESSHVHTTAATNCQCEVGVVRPLAHRDLSPSLGCQTSRRGEASRHGSSGEDHRGACAKKNRGCGRVFGFSARLSERRIGQSKLLVSFGDRGSIRLSGGQVLKYIKPCVGINQI